MTAPLDIVILAAGKGTRMNSAGPKVLHHLAGKPLLRHVIETAKALKGRQIHVVIGHGASQIKAVMKDTDIDWQIQEPQLGTGHALQEVESALNPDGSTLVLYGDVPLVKASSLHALVELAQDRRLALLTANLDNPFGYGRIVRDGHGEIRGIVEQKDATPAELSIHEVNTGIIAFPNTHLCRWLSRLENNNAQREFYLTDLISMAAEDCVPVVAKMVEDPMEVAGVNSREQLSELERHFQHIKAREMMANGISLADPNRFDLRGNLRHGRDISIDVNVVIEGEVELGDDVSIEPNCLIRDSRIGDRTRILANSVLDGVEIAEDCSIGPFARLRAGTVLKTASKIGNFVETKKAVIGPESKVNHLSYVGDATIGKGVNVGAGTITCNYDGVNKHLTEIDDGAFIGSNTALVAPVKVGRNATVAAGSVVTIAVPDEALAVARGRQRNVEGWSRPTHDKRPK